MISDLSLMPPLFLAVLGFVVVLNLVVTVGLIRDDGVTNLQKVAQAMLVWLLPIVGAGIVLAVIGSHHTKDEMKSLVPFPFYLAAYQKRDSGGPTNIEAGTCGGLEDKYGEGTCGDS